MNQYQLLSSVFKGNLKTHFTDKYENHNNNDKK